MTDTQTRLLDAVDAVIAEHGPSGVTLRRVGEAAGLSHTAGTHYFKDKRGLFTAYITRGYNLLGERIETASESPEPREALLNAAGAYGDFAVEMPSLFTVMQQLELTHVDTPGLWAARERCYFGIDALLSRYQASGWAESRDTRDLLATTWSFVHGFIALWIGGPMAAPYDGQELAETLRQLLGDLLDTLN